jgi:hypothetical protein
MTDIDIIPREDDPLVVALIKQRVAKGEKVFRYILHGKSAPARAWLRKLHRDETTGSTKLEFFTSDRKHFSKAVIGADTDNWDLLPGRAVDGKKVWRLLRRAEAVLKNEPLGPAEK